jgi:hypothetical protein
MSGRRNQFLVELNGQLRMQRRSRAALAGGILQPVPIAANASMEAFYGESSSHFCVRRHACSVKTATGFTQ